MLTRSFLLPAALLACLAGTARAQVQPEAKQKIEAMASAMKDVKAIGFHVSLIGSGGMMSILPSMKGTVTLAHNGGQWKTRVEGTRGTSSIDKTSKEMNFTLVTDGQKTTWTDEPSKTVFERSAASAAGEPISIASLVVPRELTAADPFADFVSAPTLTLDPAPATADGVQCDIISVETEKKDSYRIVVSQTDHLPRKIQKYIAGSTDESQIWSLTSVSTNVPVTDETWTIKTPDGYTFSPMPTPPTPKTTAVPGGLSVGTPGSAPTGPKTRVTGVSPDDLAPDFELKTDSGESIRLSSLKGSVVLLDFWGTWCPPCKASSPEIQKLADRYKDQPVKVLGLAVREQSDATPIAFWKDQKHTYPLLLKADDVAKSYHIRAYPTFFVIGKEGEIVLMSNWNEVAPAKLAEAIDAALAGRPMPHAVAKPIDNGSGTGNKPAAKPPFGGGAKDQPPKGKN